VVLGGPHLFVVDGVESPNYDWIGNSPVTFSSDCKRMAYAAGRGKKKLIVVDGAESQGYGQVSDPAFSPDGKHLIYVARRGGRQFIVVDGTECAEYRRLLLPEGAVIFDSPNRFHYIAIQGQETGKQNVVRVDAEIVER